MTVTTVDVTTRALEEPAIVIVYAIGVACWLPAPEGLRSRFPAYAPPPTSFSWGPVRLCSPSTTPLPIGPVAMALFLAGNSVAELGRKAEVGDVGGERHPVRVPRRTQTA